MTKGSAHYCLCKRSVPSKEEEVQIHVSRLWTDIAVPSLLPVFSCVHALPAFILSVSCKKLSPVIVKTVPFNKSGQHMLISH